MAEIERAEKQKMKIKVNKILKYKPDIVINRQLIYDYPEELFTNAGVGSIEHADFDGVERLARVLGAEIMSTFDDFGSEIKTDLSDDDDDDDDGDVKTDTNANETKEDIDKFNKATKSLGTCDKVEEMIIGEDTVIRFCGVPKGEACTIVLRGGSTHLLDEMERSIHDALCVLTQTIHETRVVLGGGACEMMMADAVEKEARNYGGKEALAMDAFANALRQIPNILADNAGLDAAEICTQLRSYHAKKEWFMGVDMINNCAGDMRKIGVYESYKSKSQSLTSAHEAAEMILRVDDIVKCAPRRRQ
eukprot:CAMPEP_0114671130 /NCGR_PEP_ID=MMETSP0191-20121206/40622_1 /TAXON_ID=126664 /ORGANISM="Sorites sp." /LENGTH=304 /DNA_ID=CAMNT_0001930209 /DNA_START=871 /DNA_END=1785 /DNA_ORIENTATION=+